MSFSELATVFQHDADPAVVAAARRRAGIVVVLPMTNCRRTPLILDDDTRREIERAINGVPVKTSYVTTTNGRRKSMTKRERDAMTATDLLEQLERGQEDTEALESLFRLYGEYVAAISRAGHHCKKCGAAETIAVERLRDRIIDRVALLRAERGDG